MPVSSCALCTMQAFRYTKASAAAVLDQPSAKRRKSGNGLSATSRDGTAANGSSAKEARSPAARSPSGAAAAAIEAVSIEEAREEVDGADQPRTAAGGAGGISVAEVAAATYVKGSKPRGLPEKLGDMPLRLILVGHNPSEHAWCAHSSRVMCHHDRHDRFARRAAASPKFWSCLDHC